MKIIKKAVKIELILISFIFIILLVPLLNTTRTKQKRGRI